MKTTISLKEVMLLAWHFVRHNGFTKSVALKAAWNNAKLTSEMKTGVVNFSFRRLDGTIRQACGTLQDTLLPQCKGTGRKADDTLQTYFDTERQAYRSFKKANLLRVGRL